MPKKRQKGKTAYYLVRKNVNDGLRSASRSEKIDAVDSLKRSQSHADGRSAIFKKSES
jgi:hypothetical protein